MSVTPPVLWLSEVQLCWNLKEITPFLGLSNEDNYIIEQKMHQVKGTLCMIKDRICLWMLALRVLSRDKQLSRLFPSVTAPAIAELSRDRWRKKSKFGLQDALQESPRNMGYPPLTWNNPVQILCQEQHLPWPRHLKKAECLFLDGFGNERFHCNSPIFICWAKLLFSLA